MNTITQKKEVNKMNVKPKFLNVMKQRIFTLVMMLALVIVTGSAYGQGTLAAPWVGVSKTYTVGGLTDGDTYTFYVTLPAVTLPTSANDIDEAADTYDFTTAATGTISGTSQTLDLTWLMGNSSDTYRLWIQSTRAGCSNYRFVTITPQNQMNFVIAGIGSGDGSYDASAASTDDGSICSTPFGTDFDANGSAAGDDGATYVYYKVTRVNGVTSYGWEFDLATHTLDGAAVVLANVEYSANGTSGWATQADFVDIPVAGGQNAYYVRFLIDPLTNADRPVVAAISNMLEATSANVEAAGNTGDNTDTTTLQATPSIGNFGF